MKFIKNLKKYYPFLLNAFIPLVLFFLPVYSTSFVDEIDTITYFYNFYNLFDFKFESLFASLNLLIVISSIINLIFFVIYMVDSYKLILHKNWLNKILFTFSFIILITSLFMLICAIYIATQSSSGIFVYYNKFKAGSVILFIYSIIQAILITTKFKKKLI